MHTEILTAPQLAVLDRLKAIAAIREFYLAGGTALALRHGHRRSIDFDFFRPTSFDEEALAIALEEASDDFERLPSGEQTLYVVLSGVTTSFHTPARRRDELTRPLGPLPYPLTSSLCTLCYAHALRA